MAAMKLRKFDGDYIVFWDRQQQPSFEAVTCRQCFVNEIFPQRNAAYNLRNSNTFTVPIVLTVKYDTETVRYRGQRIWHTLPQEIKDANSVHQFKNRIKSRKYVDCDCRLCKQYIPQLDFL